MNWTPVEEFIMGWLSSVWQIFTYPLYVNAENGRTLTGATLLFACLFISLAIWFVHTFFKRES